MFTFTNCGVICVHRQCSRRAVLASTVTVWHCGHSSRAGTTILFYGELLYQQVARNCKLLSSARMTMDIGKLYNKYNFIQPGLPPGAACRPPPAGTWRTFLYARNDAVSCSTTMTQTRSIPYRTLFHLRQSCEVPLQMVVLAERDALLHMQSSSDHYDCLQRLGKHWSTYVSIAPERWINKYVPEPCVKLGNKIKQ